MNHGHTPSEERYTAIRRLVLRILSFLGGAGILYHEVWVAETSEPILDFIALYLMGVPLADLIAHLTATNGSVSHSRKKDDESK